MSVSLLPGFLFCGTVVPLLGPDVISIDSVLGLRFCPGVQGQGVV